MRAVAALVLALAGALQVAAPAATQVDVAIPAITRSFTRDYTLDLRDTYLAQDSGALLAPARPSDPPDESGEFFWDPAAPRARVCGDLVCIHYVTTTSDAPPLTATAGVDPDWVRRNLDLADFTLARMAELGYPAAPADGGVGESAQFDIYLVDIGRAGLYGYCAPETAVPGLPEHASSYCVFDNDFVGFPMPPDESLRVTAAHELFHAIQFGMDVREDRWFIESTATWIEELIADDVNDNRQYLSSGQLIRRHVPLDHAAGDLDVYGNWIFFEFLTERYGVDSVRQLWNLAAAGPGNPNDFSIEAIRRFVQSRGSTFSKVYVAFTLANLTPWRAYAEGRSYPKARFDNSVRLGDARRTWQVTDIAVPHLAAHAIALRPIATTRAPARIRIAVSASRSYGAAATVQVFLKSGRVTTLRIHLTHGNGRRVVNFTGSRVRRVVIVVANASTRYDCDQHMPYACQGRALDDRQRFAVTANVIRERR